MAKIENFVFFEDRLVGYIFEYESGAIGFNYAEEWSHSGFEISHTLPFRKTEYKQEANLFFGNLLPEGDVRTSIALKLGISVENDFRLLIELGGDCAGALTIGKEARKLESNYEKITMEDFDIKFDQGESLFSVFQEPADEIRLSLAGAQDKLPVYVNEKLELHVPKGNSPSTHILKPPSLRFKNIPECEYLMSRLGRKLGLEVAETQLIKIGGINACLISRYDRQMDASQGGKQVRRLHQEDFCQALGVSHKVKYEKDGGPTFARAYACIEQYSHRLPEDLERLIKWLVFDIIIGNCDAHAKNLSLLRDVNGDWALSPHYDLVPTRIFPKISTKLAMSVGGSNDSGTISGTHWKRLAQEIKVGERFLLNTVKQMAETAPDLYKSVSEDFINEYGHSTVLQSIQEAIHKQTRRLLLEIKK